MSTMRWPASWIAGFNSATTIAAAEARPTASTIQLTRPSPRCSRRTRSAASIRRAKSRFNITTSLGWVLDGLSEEAEKAVSEQQHEHGQQRRDGCVHGEVRAVGGAFQIAALFGPHLGGLLAQELEIGTLFGC